MFILFYFVYTNIKFYWFVMKIKQFLLPIWWYNRGLFPLGNKYFGVFVLNGLMCLIWCCIMYTCIHTCITCSCICKLIQAQYWMLCWKNIQWAYTTPRWTLMCKIYSWMLLNMSIHTRLNMNIHVTSAVVDKPFVDKIGDKTAILRKYDISTKILFCRHICTCNNVPFRKRNYSLKKQNIDKISLQHGLTTCEKRCKWSSAAACLMLSQPLFTRPVPMIHRVNRSLDFGWNITMFISWSLFCRNVAVGMKFDPTCRQRNLSSTTALHVTLTGIHTILHACNYVSTGLQFNTKIQTYFIEIM